MDEKINSFEDLALELSEAREGIAPRTNDPAYDMVLVLAMLVKRLDSIDKTLFDIYLQLIKKEKRNEEEKED